MELMDFESGTVLASMLRNTEFFRAKVPLIPVNSMTPHVIATCIDARFDVSMFGITEHFDIVCGGGNIFANPESLNLAISRSNGFFILMMHQDCLALNHVLTSLTDESGEFKEWKRFLAFQSKNDNTLIDLLNYQLDYLMRVYSNKMKHYIGLIHDSNGSLNYVQGKVYLKRIDNFSDEALETYLKDSNLFFSLRDYLLSTEVHLKQ